MASSTPNRAPPPRCRALTDDGGLDPGPSHSVGAAEVATDHALLGICYIVHGMVANSANQGGTPPRADPAASREHEWRRQIVEQARRLALRLGIDDPPSVLTYATGAVKDEQRNGRPKVCLHHVPRVHGASWSLSVQQATSAYRRSLARRRDIAWPLAT